MTYLAWQNIDGVNPFIGTRGFSTNQRTNYAFQQLKLCTVITNDIWFESRQCWLWYEAVINELASAVM